MSSHKRWVESRVVASNDWTSDVLPLTQDLWENYTVRSTGCEAVVHLLADYIGPVAVMSFNPHAIAAVAKQAPHLCRGLVTDAFLPTEWPTVPEQRLKELAEIPDANALDVDFVSHDVATLHSNAVSRLKADGLPIFCWTVKSTEQERLARQIADQITFEGFVPAV